MLLNGYVNVMYYLRAIKINCINAEFPDQYGNYRNANYTQTKHHWWWKANTVFNRLHAVRNYIGKLYFTEYLSLHDVLIAELLSFNGYL